MLFDTHCHLNDERLLPETDNIAARFYEDGLEGVICVGYDRKSSEEAVALARKHDRIYAAVGTHPHDSKTLTEDDLSYYAQAAGDPKVAAIGEIGLDYYYDYSPREAQKLAFVRQLELADGLGLPVIFHLRDAYEDMLALIKQNAKYLKNGCLMHCYSGSAEMATQYLNAAEGMYFAFGGSLTFKNARHAAESIRSLPSDRIVLETDCPYLAPEPFRGKTNYPAYIQYTAAKAAEILGLSIGELTDITTANVKKLFKRIK